MIKRDICVISHLSTETARPLQNHRATKPEAGLHRLPLLAGKLGCKDASGSGLGEPRAPQGTPRGMRHRAQLPTGPRGTGGEITPRSNRGSSTLCPTDGDLSPETHFPQPSCCSEPRYQQQTSLPQPAELSASPWGQERQNNFCDLTRKIPFAGVLLLAAFLCCRLDMGKAPAQSHLHPSPSPRCNGTEVAPAFIHAKTYQ